MSLTAATSASADRLRNRSTISTQLSLLHVFPSFGIGGVPLRIGRVINHFGKQFRHTIIALDGNLDAARQLSSDAEVSLMTPRRRKLGTLCDTVSAALTLRRVHPDVLVTYNWGAIEWAIANRVPPSARHIHFEAGFGKEEADIQFRRRVLCRRWALARCARVVVPSRRLERIARDSWRLPSDIVSYLPNGVDVERFSAPARDAAPVLARRPGELIIGTLAPLRPEKNIGRLLRVFAMLDTASAVRLVIAGDGAERGALERLARELGISDRVDFTGRVPPEAVLGRFDIFALSSDTEQMPNAVLEAMAAGLPVASVDVGDIKSMVSADNQDFIVARDDGAGFAAAIDRLLREPATRERLGDQNRRRAIAEFSLRQMFDRYSELFLGRLPHGQREDDGHGRVSAGP
jgi:glycosyltransferase involved in cell wall biosynthesis